jgi:outer membrane protein OmpA-like peptidoglycan-associated protein
MYLKISSLLFSSLLVLSGCSSVEEQLEIKKAPLVLSSSFFDTSDSISLSKGQHQHSISSSIDVQKGTRNGLIFLSVGSSSALHPIDMEKLQELTAKAKLVALFDFDSYYVKPDFKIESSALATLKSSQEVLIVGHTDAIGSEKYNFDLGRKRADDVKKWLVMRGVNVERIKVVSMGESEPKASNQDKGGRSQNRRVEVYGRN